MARYFKEQDIDEFRDCFYLNTHNNGMIVNIDELALIMRSLGMSPTIPEMRVYLKEKGGKLSFADFLDVMHTHSKKEKVPEEILEAFQGWDLNRTGQIHVRDLKHILCQWGEKLGTREVDHILREANTMGPYVKYQDLVGVLSAPVPDY
ncbi:calmodulin [Tetranychus urticae]|uniref:calmodulin-like n=1 Tax=Tetranychus urticae TaxID=32264 RepID=UPI00077BFC3D|nr:calmodulin-like [Tetranychus urticae]XP_015789405.1 calmodulin [Tetranychus urticae]